MANLHYSYLKATSGSTRDAPPKPNAIPVIASDSPWKRRGGRTQTQHYSLYITNRVWEERLRGGTRTLVSPSTDFPAFAGVKGGLASYRYTLGDRSRSDQGRCSTEGSLFESRWRQPPEQLPGLRGHFYDLGVIRSVDVMGSAGERSPGAPSWGQSTTRRFHGQVPHQLAKHLW
jgi:hypothetical protein